MYKNYNPNPIGARVGDCSVRAICKALDQSWEKTYIMLCLYGLLCFDMPSANHVWGKYLSDKGYERHIVPMECNTVADFAQSHPKGTYVIGTNGHVLTLKDGFVFDTWNSLAEVPIYFWSKEG